MKRGLVPIVIALVVSAISPRAAGTHDDSFRKEGLFEADVSQLTRTELMAHPDLPLDSKKSVLWCGTLQLTWNKAVTLVGAKLHLVPRSREVELLNRGDFTDRDLDPASYVDIADFERNHAEDEIRAALQKTFGGAASPELIPPVPKEFGPDDFVAYSYLYKNLAFTTPFLSRPFAFQGTKVEGFGFPRESSAAMRGQAGVCDYHSPDDFIVTLKTTSPSDELILAKTTPGASLADTSRSVLERLAADKAEPVGPNDKLDVPKLNFDLRREFPELQGRTDPDHSAKIREALAIKSVKQLVRFQLNEKGAILKSEASMMVGAAAMPVSRHALVFDKPFLILLKQSNSKLPYFALWVGNAELLIPQKKD